MPTTKPARPRIRLALLAAASAVALGASGLGLPAWKNLDIALGTEGSIRIGAVRPGLVSWGAAHAAVGTVTLHDIAIEFGGVSYSLPTAVFTGLNLSQADLAALFDKNAAEPLAARLARVSAQQVAIPELTVSQRVGEETRRTVYRDVTARDIVNGRIASLASAGATVEVTGRPTGGPVTGTFGRFTLDDFDSAQAARLAESKAETPVAMARIYGAFALEDVALHDAKGPQVRIARIAGKEFSARPTEESWSETMTLLGSQADKLDKVPPVDRARLVSALADLFDAFRIGSMEATGLEVRDAAAQDQGGRIARIAFTGAAGEQPADLRMEEVEIAADNGRMRVGLIGFSGFSFQSTLEGLKNLSDKPLKDVDPVDFRALLPTVGTMRFSGLDFDLPNKRAVQEQNKEPKPENIRFTVKDVEVTAEKPVNGIPTDFRVAMNNIAFAVPQAASQNDLKDLAALGYKAADLSFMTAASWNEPGSELVVREVSLSGVDMGRATLRGVLGNVGKEVFNPDSAIALVALVDTTVKALDLTVENKGLFERAIAMTAKQQKKSSDDLRREYGMAAAVAIPAILGSSPSAKTLGQAVARFVAKPGRLTISAKTKDAAGLGIADFAALGEPAAILDKIEVTAAAE